MVLKTLGSSNLLSSNWLSLYPCRQSIQPVYLVVIVSFHHYWPIFAPICRLFFRFSIFFSNILLIQLSVSSFGFIAWNNSEFHQAGMALILLSTDFTFLYTSLKSISFAIMAGPRWYRAKDLYNVCSITKKSVVWIVKLNFLNLSAFFFNAVFDLLSLVVYELYSEVFILVLNCPRFLSSDIFWGGYVSSFQGFVNSPNTLTCFMNCPISRISIG